MRRLLALAAVVAIGVVAMPAGADGGAPPQPELEEHDVRVGVDVAPEEKLAASNEAEAPAPPDVEVDELEVTSDEVGLVGLKWNGEEDAELRILVQHDDGTWEELDDVEPADDGPDPGTEEAQQAVERRGAEHVTEPLAVDDATKVRVEVTEGAVTDVDLVTVTTPSGGSDLTGAAPEEASATPRVVLIVTLAGLAIALMLPTGRRRPRHRFTSTASLMAVVMGVAVVAAACTPTPNVSNTQPQIFSRAQWGANEGWRNCGPTHASSINQGVIHHTAGGNNYAPHQTPGIIRGIYNYHANSLGWCDIGYNFLIDRYGSIYEGRAGGIRNRIVGAHAAGFNTGSFGVAIMGNYEVAAPTNASVNSLVRLFVWKMSHHRINPYQGVHRSYNGSWWGDTIIGHRDANATSCPGRHLYARMGEIRNRVKPNVSAPIPFGNFEAAIRNGNQVQVAGWAIDPSTTAPIRIHVYHGANRNSLRGAGSFLADRHRGDVGAAYPQFGPNHGFRPIITVGPGIVCVYAISSGWGPNRNLGCHGAY